MITQRGDRYFWTTREDRELEHRASGAFHYFISPAGSGYIKILDKSSLPGFVPGKGEPRYRYMEHMPFFLGTVTYWGESDDLSLPEE